MFSAFHLQIEIKGSDYVGCRGSEVQESGHKLEADPADLLDDGDPQTGH